jgi:hypothetical protein
MTKSSDVRAGSQPARTALERAPFVLAHAAPNAGILATFYGPLQAVLRYRATPADLLGLSYLEQRRTGVAYRKEQLRIYILAGGVVAPVHPVHSSAPASLMSDSPHRSGLVNEFTS